MNGTIIIVEGNICVGKSTLCKGFEEYLGASVYYEPALDNPYLEKYYKNPKKYGLVMQIYLLKQRYETYVEALKKREEGKIVVLDRSIFSDYVFALKNKQDGNINESGFNYYLKVRSQLLCGLPYPDIVVYLDVSSQSCIDRINNLRKRGCESSIKIEYLQGLENCYKNLLQELKKKNCNCVVLNWENFGNSTTVSNALDLLINEKKERNPSRFDFKELMKRKEIFGNSVVV